MYFTTERLLQLAIESFEPTTTEFWSDALTHWAIIHEFNLHSEPTLCAATPVHFFCSVCRF